MIIMQKLILFVLFLCLTMNIQADNKTYYTKEITSELPIIDGKIDDLVWETVDWGGDFIQHSPFEGQQPSQETKFKILYDQKNLYIAFRCFDTQPDSIVQRMSRRDGFEGDWIEINIDSYNDKRTAFSFTLCASGVKGDEMITNDGDNFDSSWDPIWYGKTSIDNNGWVAEMCIPLSQLRYSNKEEHIWGLQFTRRLYRKEERSIWKFIPRDASGWVNDFGELHGISGIEPQKQIEILPYAVAKVERFEKEEGNPFLTGKDAGFSFGVDGKIGVTSDLTLDFTVNPDFGQVEADPSEVNLSAFESYFAEKRPFFIEGKSIMNFQITGGNGGFSRDNLFYSRRIGRSPHYYPDTEDNEYVNQPDNTHILGAAKLSGRTKNGWSIGVLESVTTQEFAEIDNEGDRRMEKVEPVTNYFLGRLRKDFNQGNTLLGGMITSTYRDINSSQLEYLHKQAYTGGLDFTHQWKDKTYCFNFNSVFSNVQGTEEAILNTQESSLRYFQRPDASHVSIDSSLTQLSGWGGNIGFGKQAKGHWRYQGAVTWRSPGLELNDMGYLRKADQIMQSFWIGYNIWEPFSIFRSMNINANQWRGWDFSGKNIFDGGNINFNTSLKNYWSFGTGFNVQGNSISVSELRGGPSFKTPGGYSNWFNVSSDNRKMIRFNIGGWNYFGKDNYVNMNNFWAGITIHPHNALSISISPSYSYQGETVQYVEAVDFGSEKRYVMAKLKQHTLATSIRLNYNITPNLTVQYYGQPFISNGAYSEYKMITNPVAEKVNDRYYIYNDNQITYNSDDEVFEIDETNDGLYDYSIGKPDFKFLQFRSNLVLRWEYIPGSTLFIVWNQGRTSFPDYKNFNFQNEIGDMIDIQPHNIFLIKFTYMFRS